MIDEGGNTGTDEAPEMMPRDRAAKYLSHRLGRPVTPGAMRQWGYLDQGPRFVVVLGRATYRRADLDAWLSSPDVARPGGKRTPRK